MKAEITKPYNIAPDGHTVVHYKVGDIVDGDIAKQAIKDKHAKKFKPHEPNEFKAVQSPEVVAAEAVVTAAETQLDVATKAGDPLDVMQAEEALSNAKIALHEAEAPDIK